MRAAARRVDLPHTGVLIVGGGLTGLSMALFLAWHGVGCTVVERHIDVLRLPRMRGLAPHLVELYRPTGLEPRLSRHADGSAGHERLRTVHADTLIDTHTIMPVDRGPRGGIPIDQERAEKAVRTRAVELGAVVRFGTGLVGFSEHDAGVAARLCDTRGVQYMITADYLVAADGADSAIRKRLGIGMRGPGEICRMLSVLFEADLRPALRGRNVHMAYLNRPYSRTVLMSLNGEATRWLLGTTDPGHRGGTIDDCKHLVHAALGRRLPVRILRPIPGSYRPAMRFRLAAAVAETFVAGRVFLIGDAAHHLPPQCGLGSASGVADAHNLAGKLADVLAGRADAALLDTYHTERHPVAESTMNQALTRAGA